MNLKLYDTGYLNGDFTGTQLTVFERAGYNGTATIAFDMPTVTKCNWGGKQNINDEPDIDSGDYTYISVNTYDNDKFTLTWVVSRTYSQAGMINNVFTEMNRLKKTEGVKVLFPSGSGTMNSVIYYMMADYTMPTNANLNSVISAGTKYLPIYVTNVSYDDDPKTQSIFITLDCEITK